MPPLSPALSRLEPVLYEQDGFVTTWQATQLGVPRSVLSEFVERAEFERVQQGVYRSNAGPEVMPRVEEGLYADYLALDGRRLPWERDQASVVASHATAADLLAIGTIPADQHEFTSPRRRKTTRPAIKLWVAPLDPTDVVWLRDDRIPATSAARTIVDMALAGIDPDYVRRMLGDALHRGLATRAEVADVLERRMRSANRVPVTWLRRELQDSSR